MIVRSTKEVCFVCKNSLGLLSQVIINEEPKLVHMICIILNSNYICLDYQKMNFLKWKDLPT